jgi:MFS family permease
VAAIATTAYAGFLVGPPLIGFTADRLTLPLALAFIVATSAAIAIFAPAVGRARLSPEQAKAEEVAALSIEEAAR